jgi:hypothetical protein
MGEVVTDSDSDATPCPDDDNNEDELRESETTSVFDGDLIDVYDDLDEQLTGESEKSTCARVRIQ